MTADELSKGVVNVASNRVESILSELNSIMSKLNDQGVCFYRNATNDDAPREMMNFIKFLEKLQNVAEDGANQMKKSVDAWNSILR